MTLTLKQKRAILDYVANGFSTKSVMEDCDAVGGIWTPTNGDELWEAVSEFLQKIGVHIGRFMPTEDPSEPESYR